MRELTEKQNEVFKLLQKGLTNTQIAEKLNISYGTAKQHVHAVMMKKNVKSRYLLQVSK